MTANEDSSDSQFVQAVLNGERSAFTQLVRRHDPALRRLVFSMVRNPTELEDVLQETYIKAFRGLGRFEKSRSFRAWLHRIGYTTALDYLRSKKRKQADELREDVAGKQSTEAVAVAKVDVATALSSLTVAQRTAVLLIDGHNFSYNDVAEVLDMPAGSIGYQLHEGRRNLRDLLMTSEGVDIDRG